MRGKIDRVVVATVVLLALAVVSVAVSPQPTTGAAAKGDVRVVNTLAEPVPTAAQGTTQVMGTVGASQVGTWTVGIAGTPTVALAAGGPLDTRDADRSARQPFHVRGIFSMGAGEPDQAVTVFSVPAGKRLVVEHVSAFLGVPDGQKVLFGIATRLGGMLEIHSLVAQEQGVFPQVLGLGAKATFVASQPSRFYADSSTEVIVSVARTSTTGTAAGSMVVSGHFVDLP